ncbi:MAG: hypothetical protein AUJ92_18320 [Armatimonadetes bacterium CG2_30_59_28]|nr:MAG: hypothetical protein AUJ92_18320 [Armatimonadetes bacterium CG2_30_59_28]PIU62294.1 MAG: hypothetical protein COS85_18880 [Armatimonadetes bacterium CG07_land_8_20_14_0_80_59_28]PIY38846.1 MAG: hypothetical protein COZ05_20140 [Armatimonadetes bacterium CG_4_10_14_3_um_filter_59_10]
MKKPRNLVSLHRLFLGAAFALLNTVPRSAATAFNLSDPQAPVLSAGLIAPPPTFTADLKVDEWKSASASNVFHGLANGQLLENAPVVRIGFDDQSLYLAATMPLTKGVRPQVTARKRDGPVWSDDALEVFVDPRHDHQTEYQFVVNSVGTQADLLNQNLGWNGEWQAAASVKQDSWSAVLVLPWKTLGLSAPKDGAVLGFNLGWDRQTPTPLLALWAPLTGGFHQPARFGHLVLRRRGPTVSFSKRPELGALAFDVEPASGNAAAAEATLRVTRETAVIGAQSAAVGGHTRLSVQLPMKEGRQEGGDYRCELLALAKGDDLPIVRVAGMAHVQPPVAVTLRKYFLSGKLVVETDATALGKEVSQPSFEVTLISAAGDEVLRRSRQAVEGAKASFEFSIASLSPGNYRVNVAALDASARRLATGEASFTKPEQPTWLHSKAGISDKVLPPWTPLTVSGSSQRPVVKPWGREYTFAGLPFPESLRTRDASILAQPMRFRVRADGQTVDLKGDLKVVKKTPAQVALRGTASGGSLKLISTVTIDFDGNAKVDLRLAATKPTLLEELALEAPVKKANAKYRYFFPGGWGTSSNASALPKEGWQNKFVPYVWIGDEDRGFALYTESDKNWHPADPAKAVEIVPDGEAMTMRFNLIGQPVTLGAKDGVEELPYTFGFIATPVKKPDKDVWDYHICHYGNYGLEKQRMGQSSSLIYTGAKSFNPDAGTLEMWVRVRFDPEAQFTDYASRGTLNRDFLTLTGGADTLGFYWNIDDRGMRVYLKRGDSYPACAGAKSTWREGEFHHLALSWGEELRAYVDGKLTVRSPCRGSVSGPRESISLQFGGIMPGFDIDELRLSDVQREPELSDQPYRADGHTLLLEHFDKVTVDGGEKTTAPEKGETGTIAGRGGVVEGKFGQSLAIASASTIPMLDYLKNLGVRTIVFHEHWTEYENYPETIGHQEELKSLVKACHERGLKLLLYFGYLMANTCPEWEPYHDEVLVTPMLGGYIREPAQKDYSVCYRSAWQNFIADGIEKLIAKYDIDGVYLDGTEYPWACNNRAHGCGYVRPDGTVAPTFGIFAARGMVRRIYTLVKTAKPDGQVNCHNSTCMTIPSLGWATSSWDGEQFGSIPRGADVETLLPLDAFRCEFMGRQWGVPAEFLCYERPYSTHEALSFTLLHDVLVRGSGPGLVEEASLWRAMDDFGRKQATFLPYWSNADFARVSPAGCYVTLHSRPGKGVLCIVSNLGKVAAEAQVSLDLAKLKLSPEVKATDALTGEAIPISKGAFAVQLKPFDYALVRVSSDA